MISSMTGFARLEQSGSYGQLTCEVRSVNHRYLEPGFRLPEELRALESELRQTLARELRRGKVDCTIHLRGSHEAERELLVDDEAVDRLLARSRDITERAAAKGLGASHLSSIDPIEVLRWPGVLREQATETESLHAACRQLFVATVRQLADVCRTSSNNVVSHWPNWSPRSDHDYRSGASVGATSCASDSPNSPCKWMPTVSNKRSP